LDRGKPSGAFVFERRLEYRIGIKNGLPERSFTQKDSPKHDTAPKERYHG